MHFIETSPRSCTAESRTLARHFSIRLRVFYEERAGLPRSRRDEAGQLRPLVAFQVRGQRTLGGLPSCVDAIPVAAREDRGESHEQDSTEAWSMAGESGVTARSSNSQSKAVMGLEMAPVVPDPRHTPLPPFPYPPGLLSNPR
jgi:hypothetical protein